MSGDRVEPAPELSVVIPTRGAATLRRCLDRLVDDLASGVRSAEILLVDDAAPAPLVIGPHLGPVPVRVLREARRVGFGPAVNRGVAAATGRAVAVLNDDVEVERGCFEALAAALADREVFAACPALAASEPSALRDGAVTMVDESLYRLCWDRATLRTRPVALGRSLEPHYPSGALALFDRARWGALGGFDETLAPYYWEDVELGLRAWTRRLAGEPGWRLVHVPGARALHHRHATVVHEAHWLRKTVYRRNRELVLRRHLAAPARRAFHAGALLARALSQLAIGDPSHTLGTLWSWWLAPRARRAWSGPRGTLDVLLDRDDGFDGLDAAPELERGE